MLALRPLQASVILRRCAIAVLDRVEHTVSPQLSRPSPRDQRGERDKLRPDCNIRR
ncbi:hypothetical protein CERZMDRAFT_89616 [Cercospora zeae-maydis SCOH1-5]|uniref:Uncharacterized protein n=1 Tax=Cercospora zeae-maydis SCOH1-5 TaxID=717836 RepID=A0A6A6FWK9_9PEZI|nr:hypothetical protein CERZMDRAFT_89616 [Cercospora zeae-maydis SCOH1-5]